EFWNAPLCRDVAIGLGKAGRLGAPERADFRIHRSTVMQAHPIHSVPDVGYPELGNRLQDLAALFLFHKKSSSGMVRSGSAEAVRREGGRPAPMWRWSATTPRGGS